MNWFNVNEHKVILYGKIQTISGQIIRKIVFCKQITFKYYQKSLEKKNIRSRSHIEFKS